MYALGASCGLPCKQWAKDEVCRGSSRLVWFCSVFGWFPHLLFDSLLKLILQQDQKSHLARLSLSSVLCGTAHMPQRLKKWQYNRHHNATPPFFFLPYTVCSHNQ